MTVVIVDYGSGNLRSAAKAFEKAAQDLGLAKDLIQVTDQPEAVHKADHIVLPGVGAFGACREGLQAVSGLKDALEEHVLQKGRPFLGICVGMQLMAEKGFEHGEHDGFGWIKGHIAKLTPSDPNLKIPHMGWNDLALTEAGQQHPLLQNLPEHAHAYFVHSYAMQCQDPQHCLAQVDYGGGVTAIIGKDTMLGTQFHPEKSQALGQFLIRNFLSWKP